MARLRSFLGRKTGFILCYESLCFTLFVHFAQFVKVMDRSQVNTALVTLEIYYKNFVQNFAKGLLKQATLLGEDHTLWGCGLLAKISNGLGSFDEFLLKVADDSREELASYDLFSKVKVAGHLPHQRNGSNYCKKGF